VLLSVMGPMPTGGSCGSSDGVPGQHSRASENKVVVYTQATAWK